MSLPCRFSIALNSARLPILNASRNKMMAATIDLFAFDPLNVTLCDVKCLSAIESGTPLNTNNAFMAKAGKESEYTLSLLLFVSEHSMLHNACCDVFKPTRTCTVAVNPHCQSPATIVVSFAVIASHMAKYHAHTYASPESTLVNRSVLKHERSPVERIAAEVVVTKAGTMIGKTMRGTSDCTVV